MSGMPDRKPCGSFKGTVNGSRLTWSEGGVTSLVAGRELVYNDAAGEVVLRISNFSIEDYGVYRCQCVNNFSYLQYEVCGRHEGLPTHCTATREVKLLPSGPDQIVQVRTESISTPGRNISLGNCISGWARIGSSGLREDGVSAEITVNSPQDQAKYVCTSFNTTQKIVYVTIADYQPLRILYPTSDVASLLFNNTKQVPVCATFTSLPTTTTTALYLIFTNNTEVKLDADIDAGVVSTDVERCDWITAYFVDEYAKNMHHNHLNSFFSCVVSSPWETLSVNFTIAENLSEQRQECPEVEAVTSSPTLTSSPVILTETSTTTPTTTPTFAPDPVVVDIQTSPLPPSKEYETSLPVTTTPTATPTTTPTLAPESVSVDTPLPPSKETSLPLTTTPTATPTLSTSSLPPSKEEEDGSSSVGIIAGAAVLAVAIIVTVLTVICWMEVMHRRRKSRPRRMYKLPEGDDEFVLEPSAGFRTQPSLIDSFYPPPGLLPTHNGVPVSRQMAMCISGLQQSPWLFPYEKLEFQEELGSGAFGVVKKAVAHSLQPGEPATVVAVKMLKDSALSDEQEEKDIVSELKVLQHVGAHPNIVCLLGASVSNGMLHVIVEYCCNGNLLNYLRSKRNAQDSPLTARHCVDMAVQVATGMEFLASKDCIHRDLAARNVLITEDFVLKVADFGLARKVYESVYRPSGGKVPVKWLAPESIIDHVYTVQSDVWSFGIVLWEILTLGRAPYPGKSAETMLRDLEGGYRMPRPPSCPVQIYDIMLKCWQWGPTDRPTFTQLVKLLEEILTADEPALNRHYYNMDVSGRTLDPDPSIDSTLCSCEELDSSSSAAPFYICHSCGNTFTTDRILSSDPDKIFCDDCSQKPEYLSRSSLDLLSSCDESGTMRRQARWSRRIHSNDSGVKVSSEGTSEDYKVTAGPRATAFARKLAESLQSMCTECKIELDPAVIAGSLWNDSSHSLSSICTDCRAHLDGHKYTNVSPTPAEYASREREEYMGRRKEKLLASRDHPSIDNSLLHVHSVGDEEEEEEEGSLHLVNGFREDAGKVELRQKYSNDSGIKLMSEPPYLKRVSAPPIITTDSETVRGEVCFSPPSLLRPSQRPSKCLSPPSLLRPSQRTSKYLSPPPLLQPSQWLSECLSPPSLLQPSQRPSGCSTPGRLSAHPRNRDMFDELGFEETDL